MRQIIKKSNLDDQILGAIKEAIVTGEWKVGDKIPSETQLAEMFKTSRPTVRVAIQKLNTMGLLETRVGAGTFVKGFDFSCYLDTVSDLVSTPEMLDDVAAFRKVIETECICLAIEKATDEELSALECLCDEYSGLYKPGKPLDDAVLSLLVTLDYNIHYRICSLSGNALFALAYAAAQGTLKEYFRLNLNARMQKYVQQNDMSGFINTLQAHKKLVAMMRRRDKDAAIGIISNIIDYKTML